MINFTVGPVQSCEAVRAIGKENVPYFRTPEFSNLMLENEGLMLEFSKAPKGSRVVFVTGSGTASMETAIMNTLTSEDKAIVVNGGGFGKRFVELLTIHDIPFTEIKLDTGKKLTEEHLKNINVKEHTAFVVNVHETSTGVHYDMDMIGEFCKKNDLFLIADNVSSFLADPFDMEEIGADVMITGSQKALACPPGISLMVLSPMAVERAEQIDPKCMYFNLKNMLKNGERGQTPFTPAVGTLIQIHERLTEIKINGGVESEIERIKGLAEYFREGIKDLPFEYVSESMSNAMTSLHPTTASADDLFHILKNEYGIWICPNGGDLKDTVFRVGHIGDLDKKDFDILIDAFEKLEKKKVI